MIESEEWITREDERCRTERIARLNWLVSIAPPDGMWVFHGAPITKYLFEEARYSFVYSQFLATIVLGFAFIEHTLAALFYASGRDDLERANVSLLLKESLNCGWLTQDEFDKLNQAKKIRNPVTHFRKPLNEDTIEFRSVINNEVHYSIIEEDARNVMKGVFHLLSRVAP
jgi:hypothetical protein